MFGKKGVFLVSQRMCLCYVCSVFSRNVQCCDVRIWKSERRKIQQDMRKINILDRFNSSIRLSGVFFYVSVIHCTFFFLDLLTLIENRFFGNNLGYTNPMNYVHTMGSTVWSFTSLDWVDVFC